MLVVNVEVWPGGDMRRRRVIHVMSLVNESDLNDISDYSFYIDGVRYKDIIGHKRSHGAIELIQKALISQEKLP